MRGFIAVAAFIALPGCAEQFARAAESDCGRFGFSPGSDSYAQCVQIRFSERQGQFQRSMANLSRNGQNLDPATPVSSSIVGTLRSQRVSGAYRICSYSKGGSEFDTTIDAGSICPINE